jgi:hypothetical protein
MSEHRAAAPTPTATNPHPPRTPSPEEVDKVLRFQAFWKFALAIAIVMVVLAMLGVAFTMAAPAFSRVYWIALVPIYGLLCIGAAFRRGRKGDHLDRSMIWRQLFHWLGIGLALGFDFYISGSGEETRVASGLNALLLLALGCYLAGVHLDWLFALVGGLLTMILILVAKFEQYEWLVFIVGGLAVVAMCAWWWMLNTRSHQHAAAHAATASH